MNGKFILEIELGNDTMNCADHVEHALNLVGNRLHNGADEGKIRDTNGNTVGFFSLKGD